MREATERESTMMEIRNKMQDRWNLACRGTMVETGRGTASTGSKTPIGAKRKIDSSSSTEARPKRQVSQDDL